MSQLGYNSKSTFIVMCAGLLALLAYTNTANAQLAYTNVESTSSFSNTSFPVDMDHDGINEFQITHSSTSLTNIRVIPGNNANDYLAGVWIGDKHGNYARVVDDGEMIDEDNNYEPGTRWLVRDGIGLWLSTADKYIGLEVVIDGNVRYGWIHLTVAKAGKSVTIFDYAYNLTASSPIEAGLGTTLPVELESFAALLNNDSVDLKWSTLSETANAGFELQHKSADSFDVVSFVEGNGTSTSAHSYTYKMSDLAPGVHSFRLKQIDVSGNYTYSSTVEVAIDVPGEFMLGNAYPNPFNPEATFTLAVQTTQDVTVSIYNALGQRVAQLFTGTMEGGASRSFTIDGSALSSGLYLYRVEGETFSTTKTISLMK